MNLFGKKKEGPKVVDPVQQIHHLGEQIELLDKKYSFIEAKIGKCVEDAKKRMKLLDKKGRMGKISTLESLLIVKRCF